MYKYMEKCVQTFVVPAIITTTPAAISSDLSRMLVCV